MRVQENIAQKSRNINSNEPTRDYTNSVENLRKKVEDARSEKTRNVKTLSTNDSKRRM